VLFLLLQKEFSNSWPPLNDYDLIEQFLLIFVFLYFLLGLILIPDQEVLKNWFLLLLPFLFSLSNVGKEPLRLEMILLIGAGLFSSF